MIGDGSGIEDIVCNWLRDREVMDVRLLLPNNKGHAENTYFQKKSCAIKTPSTDCVCDITSLEEIISAMKKNGRVIGGVFHVGFAGMVRPCASTPDYLLTEKKAQTKSNGVQEDFLSLSKRMPDIKLQHFLEALKDEELGFFMAVSSVQDLIGAVDLEQAIYLTHRRNLIASSGCARYPVLALDLGMIIDPSHDWIEYNHTDGLIDIQSPSFEPTFCAVLDSVFETDPPKGSVTNMLVDVNSGSFIDGKWPVSSDPRFLHIGSQKSMNQSTQKDEPQTLEQEIQACHDFETSATLFCTALAKRLGKLLACPQEDFKPTSSIAQFGIDSLVAAELRAWILQSLGSSITIEEILGRDSLIEIARNIAQRSSLLKKSTVEATKASPNLVQWQGQIPNGTSEHSLENGIEQTRNEKRSTLCYQDSLPKMPVPDLQVTLEIYLLSIRPLLTKAEYELSKSRVKAFGEGGGMGEVLQKRLEARSKDPKIKNWLYEYWVTHYYLNPRTPLAPATNFFMAHEDTPVMHSMAKRAAIITRAIIDFKNDWDNESLEPAMLHEAPICMESYHWLFNTCRIPKLGGDQSRKAQTSNHVTVIWRNSFFRLEAEQHGRTLNVRELESLFSNILKQHTAAPEPGFGVLTTENRDLWARVSLPLLLNGL